jgi:hypothetical protein
MIQTRQAVLKKPVSAFFYIAALVALMIAANTCYIEAEKILDGAVAESGANLSQVYVVPVVPLLV